MKAIITLTHNGETPAEDFTSLVEDFLRRNQGHFDRYGLHAEHVVRTGARVSAGAGGAKGQQVLAYLQAHPELGRKQVAEACGCSVARVGEVMRAAGIRRNRPAGGKKAQPEPEHEAPIDPANVEPVTFQPADPSEPQVRHEKCEHERKAKKRAGSCTKGCPPYTETEAA